MASIPRTRFARLAPHVVDANNQTVETQKAAHAQFRTRGMQLDLVRYRRFSDAAN
jgi:hypothetical protein